MLGDGPPTGQDARLLARPAITKVNPRVRPAGRGTSVGPGRRAARPAC